MTLASGAAPSKAVLGYWAIRGLAHPIRYLLEYTGTPYQDQFYTQGDAPDYSRAEWTDVKPSMDIPFANLPYFIDETVKLSQSMAIIRYIAEKTGLAGKSPQEKAIIDMVATEVNDLRSKFTGICYNRDFEQLKVGYLERLPYFLQRFDAFYGTKKWICGQEITYADFMLYEILCCQKALQPNCLDAFPRLQAFCQQIEEIPQIKAFQASPSFNLPLNNKVATFGGSLIN